MNLDDENEEELPFPFVFDADPEFAHCENVPIPESSEEEFLDQIPKAIPVNEPPEPTSGVPAKD